MPERIVTVYRFEQLWREPEHGHTPNSSADAPTTAEGPALHLERAGYEIECSAGTYDALADLNSRPGRRLLPGAPGAPRSGRFCLADPHPPPRRGERWIEPPLIALDQALATLPK